jgi:hypothetical protein
MDTQHHVRPRQHEVLIAALKLRATEIRRSQVPLLENGPHGAVEDDNTGPQGVTKRLLPGILICH